LPAIGQFIIHLLQSALWNINRQHILQLTNGKCSDQTLACGLA
jgi:hypothetical protein